MSDTQKLLWTLKGKKGVEIFFYDFFLSYFTEVRLRLIFTKATKRWAFYMMSHHYVNSVA